MAGSAPVERGRSAATDAGVLLGLALAAEVSKASWMRSWRNEVGCGGSSLPFRTSCWRLGIVAETDLITALPRRFAVMHAERFGILSFDAPLSLPGFRVNAIVPKVAMMDAGLARHFNLLPGREPAASKHLLRRRALVVARLHR